MAIQKTLKKNFKTTENGGVIITETVEKQLSKEELMAEKQRYFAQQQQIVRQSTQLKAQYDLLNANIQEIDEMIAAIPETSL
ncbi:MAG: hypothetical protein K0S75_870 [Clostridia bacterium]|jgi:hypothetical protein|nr:hypothetical protein [Clostridia bacterium]